MMLGELGIPENLEKNKLLPLSLCHLPGLWMDSALVSL